MLGVAALWLLYAAGARLFGRAVGLLAAAIEAVAFLPVFYSHLALNDVPTLAPLTLSLLGSAGVLCKGRKRDYLLAGVGLGLACASKYTAGIVIVPFVAAIAARFLDGAGRRRARRARSESRSAPRRRRAGVLRSPIPTRCWTTRAFTTNSCTSRRCRPNRRASSAPRATAACPTTCGRSRGGWAGCPRSPPSAGRSSSGAAGMRFGWMLVPAPLLFLAFMGLQGRYFGRWLLPVFPLLCLLAAVFVLWAAGVLAGLAARASHCARGL